MTEDSSPVVPIQQYEHETGESDEIANSQPSIQSFDQTKSEQKKSLNYSKRTKRTRSKNQSSNTLNESQASSMQEDSPKLNMMDPELVTNLAKKFALVNRSSGVSHGSDPSSGRTMTKSNTTSDPESLGSVLKPSDHEKNTLKVNVQRKT